MKCQSCFSYERARKSTEFIFLVKHVLEEKSSDNVQKYFHFSSPTKFRDDQYQSLRSLFPTGADWVNFDYVKTVTN